MRVLHMCVVGWSLWDLFLTKTTTLHRTLCNHLQRSAEVYAGVVLSHKCLCTPDPPPVTQGLLIAGKGFQHGSQGGGRGDSGRGVSAPSPL